MNDRAVYFLIPVFSASFHFPVIRDFLRTALDSLPFDMQDGAIKWERKYGVEIDYDVITTISDMLLENASSHLNDLNPESPRLRFRQKTKDPANLPLLAKLHGSIEDGDIVP